MTTLLALETNGALIATDQAGGVVVTATGPLRFVPAKGSRVNLCPNPRCLTNTTQWLALGTGATLARITTDGARDDALTCAEVVTTGAASSEGPFVYSVVGQPTLKTGDVVRVAFSAKRLKGDPNFNVLIQARNAANSAVEQYVSSTFQLTGDWKRYEYQFNVTNVNANFLALYLRTVNVTAATVRMTDVVFTVNDPNTTPLDLAMPGTNMIHPTTGQILTSSVGPVVQYADYLVDPATTNLVPNPWCNVDTTGWNFVTGTGARVTTHRWQGTGTCLLTATGANAEARVVNITAGSATAHTASARVRNLAAVARTFRLRVDGVDIGTAQTLQPGETRRWYGIFTATGGAQTIAVRVTDSVNAETFAIFHIQVEAGQLMTAECPAIADNGTILTGYAWSGTAHNSTSTRTANVTTMPETGHVNLSRGAILCRFRRFFDSGTYETLFDVGAASAGYDRLVLWINSNDRPELYWQTNGAPALRVEVPTAVTLDVPHEIYAQWDGTATAISLDGGTLYTGQRDLPTNLLHPNDIHIGTLIGGSASPLVGAIGGLIVTDAPLPDTSILPALAIVPWTIASVDVPVYYPVVSTDGRLVHQTRFGAVNFGIYWGGDPEGMPDWSAPFLTVARHVPGSSITKVQTLGKGALTVTYRIQLDSIEDFLALQALQGTTATLRVVGDTVTVPGTFIRVVDENFVDIDQVTLMGLGNVVVIPETREVDCDAVFLRQAS